MKVQADGFEFEFPGALQAYVFDEKDSAQPRYHGLSHAMRAVDLLIELPGDILLIEIKDFHAPDDYDFRSAVSEAEREQRRQHLNHLRDVLIRKFRDTWLYRWAEGAGDSVSKPVRYLCLLTLDNALVGVVGKELRRGLPVGLAGPRWQRELAAGCAALNPQRWNSAFPQWPLRRAAAV